MHSHIAEQKIADSFTAEHNRKLVSEIKVMRDVCFPGIVRLFGIDNHNGETLIFMGMVVVCPCSSAHDAQS